MTKIGQNNSFHRHRKILMVGGAIDIIVHEACMKIFTTMPTFFEAMPFWHYLAARPLFDKNFLVV